VIDLHCHILPDIDDGAADINHSLAIARSLVSQGYRHVIATPHSLDGLYNSQPEDIKQKTTYLNRALKQAGIELTIYPGAEYPLTHHLLKHELVTLNNSRYLLVELPFTQPIPSHAEDLFFQLQAKGYIPVLAHAERCSGIQENPELVREYIQRGILIQSNVASFFGRYGRTVRDMVQGWVKFNLIHFLATDSHRPLKYDLPRLRKGMGEKWQQLTLNNPGAILAGQEFTPVPPVEGRKSRFKSFKNILAR